MPSVRRVARLFQSIAANDLSAAELAASEIISHEERLRHHGAVRLLRGSLRPNGRNGTESVPSHTGLASLGLAGALTPQRATTPLNKLVHTAGMRAELTSLSREWKFRARLQSLGLQRRSRLFFHGPPGCGKSATAAALGESLGLPTFLVRFDSIIGSYLGQTAAHLRQVFEFAESNPCVLLFDEIDALGKKRGNPLDVGELDRIVISLMQELEHSHPRGFVVATSNLAAHIDDALWRRFDLVLEFPRPKGKVVSEYARSLSKSYKLKISNGAIRSAGRSKSFAAAKAIIEADARRAALQDL